VNSFEEVFGFLLLMAAAVLYWASAVNARDRARLHAREFCRRQEWQLLDQTVTLASLWPARAENGLLVWQRRYRFDFSPDGGQRRSGELVMRGKVLTSIWGEKVDGGRLIEEREKA
jgi:hypothetical protein